MENVEHGSLKRNLGTIIIIEFFKNSLYIIFQGSQKGIFDLKMGLLGNNF
jgi:hypothetical protein